ncbi:MAG: 5'-nucleotidase C-terminal domain-containing protein [Lachnospiraceae bacterium]|nr:5'-nucleotidase C-terminal domain-containing protein [Lachnospiraceae bacterium]
MRKMFALCMAGCMLFSNTVPVLGAEEVLSDDIVILYTNDVHTYIDDTLSYDVIAAIKDDLEKQYKHVLLVDAGDHIQGTAYGSMDKGESIIQMMNAADYDVATLGNHEFDYGMEGCLNVIELAEFSYVSSNFYHEADGVRGENVLDSYAMFECGDEKIAFVGITTPETFTKSTPAYFQDEDGNFIYGISSGENGEDLQQDVQNAINEAKEEGATQIIALGHLGMDLSSEPWTSESTIANVTGLDAFIDGHSHTVMEGKLVDDKEGNNVLLTQTGEYFDRIGMMVIDAETDEITTDFIECEEILGADGETVEGYKLNSELYHGTEVISNTDVKDIKDAWITEVDEILGEKIGSTDIIFDNYDEEGNRLVRQQETNTGDFAADALYYLFDGMGLDVDVAIMNGGGIRNKAITGEISYKTCKEIHTFGNVACLQTVTGQQLLDALEWGARSAGVAESGGFLHVSGITYKVNTEITDTTQKDEKGIWIGGPTEDYRVYDVMVYNKDNDSWDELDLEAEYNLAGYNYTLRDLGDGFAMFDGAVNVLDYVMEDYMVLANYIEGFENGVVEAYNSPLADKYFSWIVDYSDVNGSGRIKVTEGFEEDDMSEEQLWVGGVEVTEENQNDVFGDGSVTYDAETNTLTLTDATIHNENGHGIYAYGINLNIVGIDTEAEGSNDISGKAIVEEGIDEEGYEYTETIPGYGIYVEGNGYEENGSLTVTGILGDITGSEGSAISAYEDIVIQGTVSDITATGGLSSGIESSFGSVIVEGKIGDIISDYNGISAWENVTISGVANNITANGYTGIYTLGGDIVLSGTINNIVGYVVGVEAYGDLNLDDEGNEIVTGGNVIIRGNVNKISGGSVGVYTDADLTVESPVEIYATNAEEENRYAVSIGENIIINKDKKMMISKPEQYEIRSVLVDSYEDEDGMVEVWRNTVCDKQEQIASMVKFEYGYKVTFIDNMNEDILSEQEICVGDKVTKPDVPTLDGYTFGGWYMDKDCTDGNEYNFDTPVTKDISLYAKWIKEVKTYTVTYKADGVVVATITVEHGKDATAPTVPVKEGYTGTWDKDGKNITGDVEIHAVYTKIPVTEKPSNPQTGDTNNIVLWGTLLAVGTGCVGVSVISKKKKEDKVK